MEESAQGLYDDISIEAEVIADQLDNIPYCAIGAGDIADLASAKAHIQAARESLDKALARFSRWTPETGTDPKQL